MHQYIHGFLDIYSRQDNVQLSDTILVKRLDSCEMFGLSLFYVATVMIMFSCSNVVFEAFQIPIM